MSNYESSQPEPVILIWGDRVALGPVDRTMLPLLAKWENDALVAHLSGDPVRPMTADAAATAFFPTPSARPDNAVTFALYRRHPPRLIGTVGLRHIDHMHGTAEFGISIGERDCWAQGYGTEATRLMIDYAFCTLGLHAVLLEVYTFNERGIRAYARAGFREVGRRRAAHRAIAAAHDVVLMECLAADFVGPDGR